MKNAQSSYYPPRAQLPSAALNAWFEFRRAMRLERIQAPGGISIWRIGLSLLVPGYSFSATGRRHLGRVVAVGYMMAVGLFLVVLGYPLSNVAFGLLIGAHAVSILWLLRLWVDRPPPWLNVCMVTTLLAFLCVAVYWPCLNYVQEHWFLPLSTHSGIVVVQRRGAPEKVQTGDVVAYRINHERLENINIREGFGIARVLGAAGARVEFSTSTFLVDGKAHSRKAGMPGQGSFVVPQNHWFIWPDINIQLNGAVTEATAVAALQHIAIVPHNEYLGKPYRRWLGRVQTIP